MNPRRQFVLTGLALCAAAASRAGTFSSPKRSATVSIEGFDAKGASQGVSELGRVERSDAEWRSQLPSASYSVTRHEATEPPFSGQYDHNKADGLYRCICCDTALYDSKTKFDSGTGWPSFWQPISKYNVLEKTDNSFGMSRTAVACRRCDAHLGHVFPDGPRPTGLRYCMNSVAMKFVSRG